MCWFSSREVETLDEEPATESKGGVANRRRITKHGEGSARASHEKEERGPSFNINRLKAESFPGALPGLPLRCSGRESYSQGSRLRHRGLAAVGHPVSA